MSSRNVVRSPSLSTGISDSLDTNLRILPFPPILAFSLDHEASTVSKTKGVDLQVIFNNQNQGILRFSSHKDEMKLSAKMVVAEDKRRKFFSSKKPDSVFFVFHYH